MSNQIKSPYFLSTFNCNKFGSEHSFMGLPISHCVFFSGNDGNASYPMFFSGQGIAS